MECNELVDVSFQITNSRRLALIRKKGRKEMFYLTTHSTHFIYGYMASDSERGNPLSPHGLLFPITLIRSCLPLNKLLCARDMSRKIDIFIIVIFHEIFLYA